ncbi:MAG: OFA family MFS transporter [Chloroherpetonaceae bacterium]|nr:OFA family MFS transporter [Chloroherpetonaceae bacterium]
MFQFLDREHSIAPPNFNRWLFPPAALAVHLCIGQVYGLSVFNIPMTKLIGITEPAKGLDWTIPDLGWIFSIALAMLGLSAAFFGKWVELSGPRKTMFASAICWSVGFFIGALGIWLHQLWIVYFGYGVVGGIGLGLGYISPVSTLMKWFPDRPGMATGIAIMGFGGGAMIGSPLAVELMNTFKTPSSMGVWETFLVMGAIYLVFMLFGAFAARVPAPDWKPVGFNPSVLPKKLVTSANVSADAAISTPQFWLLWGVLCMNVTAGIGVLGQASPMIQEMFLLKKFRDAGMSEADVVKMAAAAGGGFTALLSLFNLVGRFFWSSLSDKFGRKVNYIIYLGLGTLLYALIPTTGQLGSVVLFVVLFSVIMSMYGGGFATIPAYLRDLFGTMQVGAIHGRLLTAWSVAAVLGPVLVNYIREYQISVGVAKADAYNITMYIMAGLLVVGFICNFLVREVAEKYHHKEVI